MVLQCKIKIVDMVKFYPSKLKSAIIALALFSSLHLHASPPKWLNGTPSIVNGATTADISVNTDQNSVVYYVVYNTAQSGLTAAQIKADAKAGTGGKIVKNGVVNTTANTDVKAYIKGLPDNSTYYVYVAAENGSSEIQANTEIKNFTIRTPKRQAELSYNTKLANGMVGYLAYFPEEYYKNPNQNFPILVFLHGMGEKTWMLDNTSLLYKVKSFGVPMLIEQGQDFPFIVISPQCPFGDWDYVGDQYKPGVLVDEVVEMAKSKYRVDANRLYITGLSMGGGGTFSYVFAHPEKVAAAIPIAGWGGADNVCVAKDVALWVFHGSYDGPGGVTNLVNNINACNPKEKAKVTVYDGVGHDAWTITYNNTGYGIAPDNIYSWLLRHSKTGVTTNPVAITPANKEPIALAGDDQTITLPVNSITLNGNATDEDGTVAAYSWTQLSGPASTIGNGTSKVCSVSGLAAGSYTYQLSVTDDKGAKDVDEVSVIVKAAPSPAVVTTPNSLLLTGLSLADADKDVDVVFPFKDGYTINLSTIGVRYFSVIAKNGTNDIGSVVFTFDGNNWRTENYAPYSFTGNCFGNYHCYNSWWTPAVGQHTITATAYSGANGTGTKGTTQSVTFNVVDNTSIPVNTSTLSIKELTLANADADKNKDLVTLKDGLTVNLATTGANTYTFIAKNLSPDVKSVAWSFDGYDGRIENYAPFSFTGNCLRGYTCYNSWWAPSVGTHTVTATPYSEAGAKGTKGTPITFKFTVINQGSREGISEEREKITVSPNPFTDKVVVSFNNSISVNNKITVVDGMGLEVFSNTYHEATSNVVIDLASEKYKAGLYNVKVESDNGLEIFKLIKN